jgi:hypothetical protein
LAYHPECGIFQSFDDKNYYGALALSEDFPDVIRENPPVIVDTCLLPYNDKIIWDGLVRVSSVVMDSEMTDAFLGGYEEARESGIIITKWAR